jgi:hypothetical protein
LYRHPLTYDFPFHLGRRAEEASFKSGGAINVVATDMNTMMP